MSKPSWAKCRVGCTQPTIGTADRFARARIHLARTSGEIPPAEPLGSRPRFQVLIISR
jgi:hypothetical protein